MSDVPASNGSGAPAAAAPAAPAADAQATQLAQQQQNYKQAQQQASTKKRYNIKVDGREEEVEFDPYNEEEVKKNLQMSRASQKRMQQFAEYEKGVRGLFEQLQNDPLKVISDPRLKIPEATRQKMAQAIINNEIEEMQKSPEQREKERLQREYESLKKQHEEEKKAREASEFSRLQEQAAVQLDTDISAAIESAKLPKTARTVKYMAEALMLCLQNGLDLNARDVLPYVQDQILGDFREIIGSLPDEEFEEWLGKDQISRIRKRTLQRIKQVATASTNVKSTGNDSQREADAKKNEKKIPMKDFFKTLGKF
jgi:hypothetical protein